MSKIKTVIVIHCAGNVSVTKVWKVTVIEILGDKVRILFGNPAQNKESGLDFYLVQNLQDSVNAGNYPACVPPPFLLLNHPIKVRRVEPLFHIEGEEVHGLTASYKGGNVFFSLSHIIVAAHKM